VPPRPLRLWAKMPWDSRPDVTNVAATFALTVPPCPARPPLAPLRLPQPSPPEPPLPPMLETTRPGSSFEVVVMVVAPTVALSVGLFASSPPLVGCLPAVAQPSPGMHVLLPAPSRPFEPFEPRRELT